MFLDISVIGSINRHSSSQNYEEDIKEKILDASLSYVVELGWSKKSISAGAQTLGYPGVTHGLFPRGGADLINYFQKRSNIELVEFLKEVLLI